MAAAHPGVAPTRGREPFQLFPEGVWRHIALFVARHNSLRSLDLVHPQLHSLFRRLQTPHVRSVHLKPLCSGHLVRLRAPSKTKLIQCVCLKDGNMLVATEDTPGHLLLEIYPMQPGAHHADADPIWRLGIKARPHVEFDGVLIMPATGMAPWTLGNMLTSPPQSDLVHSASEVMNPAAIQAALRRHTLQHGLWDEVEQLIGVVERVGAAHYISAYDRGGKVVYQVDLSSSKRGKSSDAFFATPSQLLVAAKGTGEIWTFDTAAPYELRHHLAMWADRDKKLIASGQFWAVDSQCDPVILGKAAEPEEDPTLEEILHPRHSTSTSSLLAGEYSAAADTRQDVYRFSSQSGALLQQFKVSAGASGLCVDATGHMYLCSVKAQKFIIEGHSPQGHHAGRFETDVTPQLLTLANVVRFWEPIIMSVGLRGQLVIASAAGIWMLC